MEALAETHLGRMEGLGCPETHRQPQAVPDPPPRLSTSTQGAKRCQNREGSHVPHPGDSGFPALTWRQGQPGASSGTWHNPSLRGARASLTGRKDSALGRGVSLGNPVPPAAQRSTEPAPQHCCLYTGAVPALWPGPGCSGGRLSRVCCQHNPCATESTLEQR